MNLVPEKPLSFETGKLIQGLTYQEYHDAPGLRSGVVSDMRRSPAHAKAKMDFPKESTEALEFGKLFHLAIENGEKFKDMMILKPEFTGKTLQGKESNRSKEAQEKAVEWFSNIKPGQICVSRKDQITLTGMLNSISAHSKAKHLLRDSIRESSGWVRDPVTGLLLKFRPDNISVQEYVVDFKSTMDASKEAFFWDVFGTRGRNPRFYILNAAHYSYCGKLMGLRRHDTFVFIAVEKEPPYGLNVFAIDRGQLDIGEQWRARLTQQYAECASTMTWPCYPELVQSFDTPENPALPEHQWEEEEI